MCMNNHLERLRQHALRIACVAVACGGFYSCHDSYKLDDEGNYPSWLGSSIYDALKNPNQDVLTGKFSNYLQLIDDLGYADVLGKTGSKTVFVANDSAFSNFFANNTWGVRGYSDLNESQKKQLLYTSMLDNAMLLEMLSNYNSNGTITRGIALKHLTAVNVIDTIYHLTTPSQMPQNNSYWDRFRNKDIYVVSDATRPMLVHFTSEQMTANNITTSASNGNSKSDFEIITGSPYTEGSAYVFRNKVIKGDVTCQNGYIHQVNDVLVPPGNIAQVIRNSGESNYFSRMLDRFSVPVYNSTVTNNYKAYLLNLGKSNIPDSIFEVRYFNDGTHALRTDPNGSAVLNLLPFDPGWNQYENGNGAGALSDICAIFVPTDDAMKKYFLPNGEGAFLIDNFGKYDNTEANLNANIDSIPQNIVAAFLSNLMKSSFNTSVPSKFGNIMDDASDPMGIKDSLIHKNSDNTYDVKIANNGVVYMLDKVFGPSAYNAVSAPALLSDSMRVMNWAIQNKTNDSPSLNLNFYAYLLAMSANYALFIPLDEAFDRFYIDPAYLGHEMNSSGEGPRALHFYWTPSKALQCSAWSYDPSTNSVGDSTGVVAIANVTTQLTDILNYHTVVLNKGEVVGSNKYYKTKHGGAIRVDQTGGSMYVRSGAQIDNGLPTSNVVGVSAHQNGRTYRLDHVIQGPQNSVHKTLLENENLRLFYNLCQSNSDVMSWAGISDTQNSFGTSEQDKYNVFVSNNGLDYNVKFFNTYNYTVYVPNNSAMEAAFAAGLPSWDDLVELQQSVAEIESQDETDARVVEAKNKAKLMIEEINRFVRYHFQDNSIYVDNSFETGSFQTQCADTLGIYQKVNVGGSDNRMVVTDARDNQHVITSNGSAMVNKMARDFVFNLAATRASSISTSSFAVVHEISSALNPHSDTDRYDNDWQSARAMKQAMKRWNRSMKLFLEGVYR